MDAELRFETESLHQNQELSLLFWCEDFSKFLETRLDSFLLYEQVLLALHHLMDYLFEALLDFDDLLLLFSELRILFSIDIEP